MLVSELFSKSLPAPDSVRDTLGRHILTDGYKIVLDMVESEGIYLKDAVSGKTYVDLFTFYASNPLGMNHPKLRDNEPFKARLLDAALNKVANSDIYTRHFARFIETFDRVGIPEELPHAFFVSGGALAVENALKTAFDWKVRKNFQRGYSSERGHQIMHFEQSFHGRSGYTMSLTNTDPNKIAHFPKFDWPRIVNPHCNGPRDMEDIEEREEMALNQAKTFFHTNKDDIAAIIIEPIQGEGGDNHFRTSFLQALRTLADENEALLIFDEVQTGVALTGTFWAYQGIGVTPDILAFGKKTQVCGILAGRRVDEVDDNVFRKSSRINSTWGGNLVDMVRFDRILEVIEEDELIDNARDTGSYLLERLTALEERFEAVTNPRGAGLMCAFDLPDTETRNEVRQKAYEHGAIILGCGPRSVRFRPSLCITPEGLDEGLEILEKALVEVLET
ncbi:MAG: L-lysine 6-transaminase [Rubricoccaceae bacterium]|nr:L-lysine 6-transaminase [Rubricoccaceae bacterium]